MTMAIQNITLRKPSWLVDVVMNWKIIDESTSNFKPMVDGFPLIVAEDPMYKVCPECNHSQDEDNEKCEECGANLSDVDSEIDEYELEEIAHEMWHYAFNANDAQDFYEVSIESGYYSGCQFWVEDKYDDIENWDDDDAYVQFGVDTTAEAIELKEMAKKIVIKALKQAKKELGLLELKVSARFSNGETMYDKVDEASTVTCDGCGREVHDDTVEVVGDYVLCDRCRQTSESNENAKIDSWYAAGLDVWVAQYECDYNGEHIKSDTFSGDTRDEAEEKAMDELETKYGIIEYDFVNQDY